MTPEEQARQEIDRQLAAAGWLVQDRARMDIYVGPGVAIRMQGLLPDAEPTPEGLAAAAKELMRAVLRPFTNVRLQARIMKLQTASEQVIEEVSIDTLLYAGHDAQVRQRAKGLVEGFRAFIEEHRNEIEALQVLYGRPYRAGLRFG